MGVTTYNFKDIAENIAKFKKHIVNELAEGLLHLPSTENVEAGKSIIVGDDGNPKWGNASFIPTLENAAYGIQWSKNDKDIERIGNRVFHKTLPIQNGLKGCVHVNGKIKYFLNETNWLDTTKSGIVPIVDGSDGDVGVAVTKPFYIKVIDLYYAYQLWISEYNIDGTWTYIKPFIIGHNKSMTRVREDGVEEAFNALISSDNERYIGGNKDENYKDNLYGKPRTGISVKEAIEFCNNRGNGLRVIKYLEYCAIQALYYIEYANFNIQDEYNEDLTEEGFKQGGLGPGITNVRNNHLYAYNNYCPILSTYQGASYGNESIGGVGYSFRGDGDTVVIVRPASYRGITNIFGDIHTFIGDVVAITIESVNISNIYTINDGYSIADITIDDLRNNNEKCTFIGKQITDSRITGVTYEFDLSHGAYFIPGRVAANYKYSISYAPIINDLANTEIRVLYMGRTSKFIDSISNFPSGIGDFYTDKSVDYKNNSIGFFSTIDIKP